MRLLASLLQISFPSLFCLAEILLPPPLPPPPSNILIYPSPIRFPVGQEPGRGYYCGGLNFTFPILNWKMVHHTPPHGHWRDSSNRKKDQKFHFKQSVRNSKSVSLKIGSCGLFKKRPLFSFFLMRKPLCKGQKWFLSPYFPPIGGMFVLKSGRYGPRKCPIWEWGKGHFHFLQLPFPHSHIRHFQESCIFVGKVLFLLSVAYVPCFSLYLILHIRGV